MDMNIVINILNSDKIIVNMDNDIDIVYYDTNVIKYCYFGYKYS